MLEGKPAHADTDEVIEELSSDDLIKDVTASVQKIPFIWWVGDRRIRLYLKRLSWIEYMRCNREVSLQIQKSPTPDGAILAELYWVLYGTVDKDGRRYFRNWEQVCKLRDGDPVAVAELIHAIKVLSGQESAIDWDSHYGIVKDAFSAMITSALDEKVRPLVVPDYLEAYDQTMDLIRSVIDDGAKMVIERVSYIAVKRFQYGQGPSSSEDGEEGTDEGGPVVDGGFASGALTDEELGNE